jgi:septal ring factor EnvC (AmiA/AmiB activator)
MEGKIVWLFVGIAALSVPALAQTGSTDTLSALLVEVRQLRIAMERAATTTPQVQLLGARLSVQNERLARAERDHDSTKRELEEVSAALAQMTTQIEEIENAAAQEQNPERQRALSMEARAATSQRAEMSARQLRLRARESELATRFGSEELKWTELNRRLDEIERTISGQPAR